MKKLNIFIIIILLITIYTYPEIKVETGKVIKQQISDKYEFEGYFSLEKTVNIFPKIRGILLKLYKSENTFVKKDEHIALIKRDDPGYKFKPLTIFSPINGVIVKINSYEGTRVNPQSPILVIGSYDKMIFSANIPVDLFYKIRKGDKVKIKIDGFSDNLSGIVYTKLNAADPKLKTAIVKIKINNPNYKIVPNISGTAIIEKDTGEVLLAPADAIFTAGEKYYVWKVVDNKAYKTEVKIGNLIGKYFEIKSGVSEGDTLVTFGAENLKNGNSIIF